MVTPLESFLSIIRNAEWSIQANANRKIFIHWRENIAKGNWRHWNRVAFIRARCTALCIVYIDIYIEHSHSAANFAVLELSQAGRVAINRARVQC
ncbi:hypothetical protein D3C85_1043040 [compost metagenome]